MNLELFQNKNINLKKSKRQSFSHVQLFATAWTVAQQAPLSMGFSRQEHWSGLSFSSPEDLPDSVIEPRSPALQSDSLLFELQGRLSSILHLFFLKDCIFP